MRISVGFSAASRRFRHARQIAEQHPSPDRHRKRLYRITEDDTLSFEEKRDRILELGRAYLGVEHAQLGRMENESLNVVATAGETGGYSAPSDRFPRATTFCRRTVEEDTPLALSDATEQGWADDPAYRSHGLRCYLGGRRPERRRSGRTRPRDRAGRPCGLAQNGVPGGNGRAT